MENKKRRALRKKKGSNLFVKYFTSSAVTIAVSLILIGLMMIFFIATQWWTDKVDVLTANAENIVDVCGEIKSLEDIDESLVTTTLRIMSASTQSEYFITDKQGNVILCGDCESGQSDTCENHKDLTVSLDTLTRVKEGGFSDYVTDEDFGAGRFVVAKPVKDSAGQIRCVVFAVEDSITGLVPYVASISVTFFYLTLFALAVVCIGVFFMV